MIDHKMIEHRAGNMFLVKLTKEVMLTCISNTTYERVQHYIDVKYLANTFIAYTLIRTEYDSRPDILCTI